MNIIEGQPIPRPDYSNMHAVDVEKGQSIDEDTIKEGYWVPKDVLTMGRILSVPMNA